MNSYIVVVLLCCSYSSLVIAETNDRNGIRIPHWTEVCPLAAHPDPNRFIQYKPDREPVEKKCDEGLIFSYEQCSCIWGPPPGCDKRPSKLGITYYEQNSNNYWLTMVCAMGTAFSPSTCDCSVHLRINHVNNNPFGQPTTR
ncbi:uncharacterized protein LOC133188991 [Saccostrea echinata]|uniref:uncharacterized protein LOC133188991 n=1 Tax=Saccostrea echinata TaxID=191078 RepID=UPI002A818121|nr:uncharacterized protein LOC133188991 [Saccostrea echinata]